MKTAYTPGPWRVGGPYPSVSVCRIVAAASDIEPEQWEPVCIVDERIAGEPDTQALADAQLIASVHELLEALKLVLIFHDGGHWTSEKAQEWANGLTRLMGPAVERRDLPSNEATTKNLCTAVRAAISKATGGNP